MNAISEKGKALQAQLAALKFEEKLIDMKRLKLAGAGMARTC
jgi:hypothetical protein